MSTMTAAQMPTIALAGRLARLSPGDVGLVRQAYTSAPHRSVHGVLTWQPAVGNWTARYRIELATPRQRCTMWLEGLQGFSSIFAGPLPAWPPEQWQVLVEHALEPVLDAVGAIVAMPVALASAAEIAGAPPALPHAAIGFSFAAHDSGRPVFGAIELRAGESYCFARAAPLPYTRYDRLAVPLQIRLGSMQIAIGLLPGLQAGDVLRLDTPPHALRPVVRLLLHGRAQIARASAYADQLTIVDLTSHARINMTSSPLTQTEGDAGSSAPQTVALDALEIELAFDLGTLNLPLAEIAQLRPGVVLGLGQALRDHLVTIRSNGQAVGRGELVLAGEELAVRISHWTICSNA